MERYSRQIVFPEIGEKGQRRLFSSKAAIFGLGALGGVSANWLCRAGVGCLRLVDMDYPEIGNLHRQLLYDEEDVKRGVPKAVAAAGKLHRVNSSAAIEPVVEKITASNIKRLVGGMDVVIDAVDNMETRLIINEACVSLGVPWIYCGVLGSTGMTMNILPGEGPCLRCLVPARELPDDLPATSAHGVIGMIAGAMASVQSAEAVKILLGSNNVRKNLFTMDVWRGEADFIDVGKEPDCPVCVRHKYEYIENPT